MENAQAEHVLGEEVVLDQPSVLGLILRDDGEVLVASTNLTYEVPIYTKTFAASGVHTIRIGVDGTKDTRSSNTYVVLDGLQVSAAASTLTEDFRRRRRLRRQRLAVQLRRLPTGVER